MFAALPFALAGVLLALAFFRFSFSRLACKNVGRIDQIDGEKNVPFCFPGVEELSVDTLYDRPGHYAAPFYADPQALFGNRVYRCWRWFIPLKFALLPAYLEWACSGWGWLMEGAQGSGAVVSSPPCEKSRWITLLIFLAYALLALIMTWPVISRLGTELAGSHSDIWIHQWTFWWIKEALLNGQNPFFTPLLYYPSGVSLTSHNIAWFNIALWLPLQAVAGSVAAYNLIFVTVYALNGFVFYLFARELTNSRAASFIGGLVFGFWPYTMSHNDHPNMVVLFWVPLAMLFLQRTYEQQKLRYALMSAVALAMIGITRWQLLVMSAPILGAYVLYLFLTDKNGRTQRNVGLFLLAGALAVILMVPLAAPLVRDQLSRDDTVEVTVDEREGVTDLLSYVIPPALLQLLLA